jgi:hypothetical protein
MRRGISPQGVQSIARTEADASKADASKADASKADASKADVPKVASDDPALKPQGRAATSLDLLLV